MTLEERRYEIWRMCVCKLRVAAAVAEVAAVGGGGGGGDIIITVGPFQHSKQVRVTSHNKGKLFSFSSSFSSSS